eukprot:CAMPEP_0119548520 /NCGR_PEP_ID=MMETSP1352-20130426/2425_1 /TAXON_ID=265584 /ORGANISM="Stauroneis constricta, Strain CCMP1120" /LENGTH=1351 /DNA_ID=CAMNT_0007593819 /DNA_START=276 /DNA_END=4331 /DNA_ORIENTATION=-
MDDDNDDLIYIDDDDDDVDVNANTRPTTAVEDPSLQRASEEAANSTIANDEAIKARERARRRANNPNAMGPGLVFESTTISAASSNTTTMASAMAVSGPEVVADSIQLGPGLVMGSATVPGAVASSNAPPAPVAAAASAPAPAAAAASANTQRHRQTDAEIKAQIRASRNAPGVARVGAVSVAAPQPAGPPAGYGRRGGSQTSAAGAPSPRAVTPMRPGAVSVSNDDDATVASSQVTAEELARMSPNSRREHQDAVAKSRARRATRRMNNPNGGSATSSMSRGSHSSRYTNDGGSDVARTSSITSTMSRSVASTYNSTVVGGGQQQQPQRQGSDDGANLRPVTMDNVNKRQMTRDELDRQAKMRASGRSSAAAATPGAVPSRASAQMRAPAQLTPAPMMQQQQQQYHQPPPTPQAAAEPSDVASVSAVTTTSIRSSETTQEQRDRQSKIRASMGQQAATMRPGAVSVAPPAAHSNNNNAVPQPDVGTSAGGFRTRRPRAGRRGMPAGDDDASVMTSESGHRPGVHSVTSNQASALEERTRRKIEAATGGGMDRGSRHRMPRGSNHSASMYDNNAVAPGGASIASVTTQSHSIPQRSSFSSTSAAPGSVAMTAEQQRERRMQEKMMQMDNPNANASGAVQANGGAPIQKGSVADNAIRETMGYYDKADAAPNAGAAVAAPGAVHSEKQYGMTTNEKALEQPEDDRTRRLNAKLSQMARQEAENENRARENRGEEPLELPPVNNYNNDMKSAPQPLMMDEKAPQEASPEMDPATTNTMGMHQSNFASPLISSSTNNHAVTTTADRGMASAPSVEYGEMHIPMLKEDNLAIAVAINEDEEEEEKKFIQAAVEYVPEKKPPLYHNRRVQLYTIGGVLTCLTIILVVLVTVVFIPKDDNSPAVAEVVLTLAPTGAPTTIREGEFRNFLARKVGEQIFVPGTPHDLAVRWLMDEDPLKLVPESDNFVQRYMLAFLYFSTTAKGEWFSCGRDDADDTCTFQKFERNTTDDSAYYVPVPDETRWLSGTFECEWVGVDCGPDPASRNVFEVKLIGQNLTGTLPSELSSMSILQSIALAYNQLTGTLPTEFTSMPYLASIEVHGNNLTGTIPEMYYDADGSFALINLAENLMSGTISTMLGQMTGLKGFHIYSNNFGGTIPTEIARLRSMSYMRLGPNEFTGQIPSELARLTQLNELWLQTNKLSGTIPTEMGRLTRLTDFRVAENAKLGGTIPTEIMKLTNLQYLFVEACDLVGPIPAQITELQFLQSLKVSRNRLTGTIPSGLATLQNLKLAWLHLNDMQGSMPVEICDAQSLSPNVFGFLQTDCDPPQNPAIPCECCTACCDRATELCFLASGAEIID